MKLDPKSIQAIKSRVLRWALFSIVLSLAPLAVDYLALIRTKHGGLPGLDDVIEHGELCLICTVLAGAGAGELIGVNGRTPLLEIVLGFICLLLALLSICMYIFMKPFFSTEDTSFLTGTTWWIFGATIISSSLAVSVAEVNT